MSVPESLPLLRWTPRRGRVSQVEFVLLTGEVLLRLTVVCFFRTILCYFSKNPEIGYLENFLDFKWARFEICCFCYRLVVTIARRAWLFILVNRPQISHFLGLFWAERTLVFYCVGKSNVRFVIIYLHFWLRPYFYPPQGCAHRNYLVTAQHYQQI